MAIRGVSNAEREPYILKTDPAHPDNIKAEVTKVVASRDRSNAETTDADRQDIEANIKARAGAPTVFFIGNLTNADRVELGDLTAIPTMNGSGGITLDMRRNRRNNEAVRRGLRGWENMLNSAGKPAPFVEATYTRSNGTFGKGPDEDTLGLLNLEQIAELAEAVLTRNGMTGDMVKNFEGQSQVSEGTISAIGDATKAVPQNSASSEDAPAQPSPQEG